MSELTDNIRKYRIKRGYTLEELAKLIGTTRQNINRYEQGLTTNIPLEKIEQLAKVFNVHPGVLMGWKDDSEPTEKEKLIDGYNELSSEGKTMLMNYLTFLLQSEHPSQH